MLLSRHDPRSRRAPRLRPKPRGRVQLGTAGGGARARERLAGNSPVAAAAALGLVLVLVACGSSSRSSAPAASNASAASSSGSARSADIAAAARAIEPYVGRPGAFPVDTPLKARLPAGTTLDYLQCGAPYCALIGQLLGPPVKAIGANLKIINAGSTAPSAQAAAATALTLKPAAVLITGIVPSEYGDGLKNLAAAGIKVVSITIPGPTKQYGIAFNYIGLEAKALAARLMADWVIVHKGANANVAVYGIPELAFTAAMETAFMQELAKDCPSCKVRIVPIGLSADGTTAPQTVVTDLQAHPSTNYMVFEAGETAQGLPAAMKAAGLSVPDIASTPEPQELQDIKTGGMTAGLAADISTQLWTWVDVVARLLLNQSPTAGEVAGINPLQFLTEKDITFNPAKGWVGYPDFATRFATLWHVS